MGYGAFRRVGIALIPIAFAGCFLTQRGLAPDAKVLSIPGLSSPVTVKRDPSGIPHIYAANRIDLARALGFVQAQDRLLQMEMLRRQAEGRLSEVLGRDTLELDFGYRLLDAERFAEDSIALYPAEVRAELEAFSGGINAWIDQLGDKPPLLFTLLGFPPSYASPVDIVAATVAVSVLLSCNLNEELLYLNLANRVSAEMIAELLPVGLGLPLEIPPLATSEAMRLLPEPLKVSSGLRHLAAEARTVASNNWVVDGTKSTSGKPLLANDPHLPQLIPSIWYEAVLCTPDGCTAGAMIAGSTAISIGTNGHVAWGVTNAQADLMDLSIEQLSSDGKQYLFKDQWYPVEERQITIRVKGEADVVRNIRSTRNGPLVTDQGAPPSAVATLAQVPLNRNLALSLRFSGLTPGGIVWTGIEAAQARTGKELVEAYRSLTGAALNLVWADTHGSIGWHVVGAIPKRSGYTGKYPTPGWTGEYEWRGTIPFDDLPRLENPPSHVIVTANDRVADVSYNGSWMPPWRRNRIAELLNQKPLLTVEDFKTIQNDRISLYGRLLRDSLLEAGDGGDEDRVWALEALRAWDGSMEGDNRTAAIVAAAQVTLPARVLKNLLGSEYDAFLATTDWEAYNAAEDILARPKSPLWEQVPGGRIQALRDSLSDALSLVTKRLGPDRSGWRWDRLNSIRFSNPLTESRTWGANALAWYLDRGPYPGAGGRHTINNGWFNLRDPFKTVQISSYRLIIDLATPNGILAMNHTGESEIPASRHYDDMIDPWRRGEYHQLDSSSAFGTSESGTFSAAVSMQGAAVAPGRGPDNPTESTKTHRDAPPTPCLLGRSRTRRTSSCKGKPRTAATVASPRAQEAARDTKHAAMSKVGGLGTVVQRSEPISEYGTTERISPVSTSTSAAPSLRLTTTLLMPNPSVAVSHVSTAVKNVSSHASHFEGQNAGPCLPCEKEAARYDRHCKDYDVREAAKLFSGLAGILAGFGITAIVLLFQWAQQSPSEDKDRAIVALFVSLFACVVSAFLFAALAGDELLTPRTLSISVVGAGVFGTATMYVFWGLALLALAVEADEAKDDGLTIVTVARRAYYGIALLVPWFVVLPVADTQYMFSYGPLEGPEWVWWAIRMIGPSWAALILAMISRRYGRKLKKFFARRAGRGEDSRRARFYRYSWLPITWIVVGTIVTLAVPVGKYEFEIGELGASVVAFMTSLVACILTLVFPYDPERKPTIVLLS